MTTVGLLEPGARGAAPRLTGTDRVWRVVRLHYANRFNSIVIPLMIPGIIFGAYLVVRGLVVYAAGTTEISGDQYSTAIMYVIPYQIVFAVQAMNLTFPYALGLSSTRRDYYLGTAAMFGIQAAAYSILFTAMSYLEQWSNGWWLGAHVFRSVVYGEGPAWQRLLEFFCGFVFALFAGSIAGAVFVRWRANGLYALGLGLALVMLGAVALITFGHGWDAVGRWFVSVGSAGFAAWLLLPAAAFAVLGFFTLRRATPRS